MPATKPDIRDLGARYAKAWSSLSPDAVASFYEKDGRITINGGEPLVGRAAIAEMAKGFYDAFPNLIVRMDDIRMAGSNAIFMWTLEGTHSTTRNFVKVGGWEEWTLSADALVAASRGYFDAVEYERQIAHGI
jgi:uncharacterized protein (TIGR02246 family)